MTAQIIEKIFYVSGWQAGLAIWQTSDYLPYVEIVGELSFNKGC